MKRALFVGSFDPITKGHLNIIQKSLKLVDELVIGIGVNASKHSRFPLEAREAVLKAIFAHDQRVKIVTYSGELTIHLAQRLECVALIRGLRDTKDFEYEQTIAQMNAQLAPELTSVFIMPEPNLRHISSSLVKEIAAYGEDISSMVPKEAMTLFTDPSLSGGSSH